MQRTHYERLSAQDASFLGIEEANARWHEGAVMVFDPGPLAAPEGGVDAARITAAYAAALDRVERYRQRLAYIPFFEHPVWVDDPTFNIRYHIRHISLPRPGDERSGSSTAWTTAASPSSPRPTTAWSTAPRA
jgi:hypothetical protein